MGQQTTIRTRTNHAACAPTARPYREQTACGMTSPKSSTTDIESATAASGVVSRSRKMGSVSVAKALQRTRVTRRKCGCLTTYACGFFSGWLGGREGGMAEVRGGCGLRKKKGWEKEDDPQDGGGRRLVVADGRGKKLKLVIVSANSFFPAPALSFWRIPSLARSRS